MKSVNIEEIDAICAKADDVMMEGPYHNKNHGLSATSKNGVYTSLSQQRQMPNASSS